MSARGNTPARYAGKPSLLVVDGISVRFAGVKALTGAFFELQPGKLFAIVGANGAGQTSSLNVIWSVSQPDRGQATFDGRDLLQLKIYQVARAGIARTFQSLGQFPNTTVLDYLLLGRHTRMQSGILLGGLYIGRTRSEEKKNRAYCLHLLSLLGLERWHSFPLRNLPYGLQKRADIARALALAPRLLLLDEPVAGMSVEETENIAAAILQMQDQLCVSHVLGEHDIAMVL